MPAPTTHLPSPDSWYAASTTAPPERPALLGRIRADVCVVGGGIAGCSTALHLASQKLQVVLLEQQRIGSGASGRSGAQALPGIAIAQDKLEHLVSSVDARRIWDMSVEGLDLIHELIDRHHIDCDWVGGHMQVARQRRQVPELARWQEELHTCYGYGETRLLGRDEVAHLIASRLYHGGLHDSRAGHLHPLRYTLGLAGAAAEAGAHIHENSRVIGYERQPQASWRERVVVRTAQGEVHCSHVAFTGNALLNGTVPEISRKIMPVGTYMVATEPLGVERAASLIRNNAAVCDLNWIIDYFRRSADHRLLFGGRVSYSGLDARSAAHATRARMLRVFPQLADARITHSWGGYLDITRNRAPHFGRLAPDVWFLQGFSGHGIALAGIAGKILAEAIVGQSGRFDVFARIPHRDFPGGQRMARPILMLAMLWYRLRDWL